MITNKIKNILAKENGFSTERKIEIIRESARKDYTNAADEIAILRKMVAYLLSLDLPVDPENPTVIEFNEYNSKIETIKAEASQQLET